MEYDLALNGWSFKEYIPHQKVKLHGTIDGEEHITRLYAPVTLKFSRSNGLFGKYN